MSEGKELKFKFVVDEQSAQRVNRVLDEMIKRAESLAKTLQGVGSGVAGGGIFGGGSVGGKAPSAQRVLGGAASTQTQKVSFASVITQNVDMLKKMGTEGTMTMKVMTDALVKGIESQRAAVGGLESELVKLLNMYKEVSKTGDAAFTGQMQGQIAEHTGKLAAARKELKTLNQAKEQADAASEPDFDIDENVTRRQRFKAFLGRGLGKLKPSGVGSLMSGIAGAAAVANFGLDESLAGDRAYSGAEGRRGQLVENRIRSMHGGDTKFLFNLSQIQKDQDARRELGMQTSGTASTLEQVRGGVGQFAGSMPLIGSIVRALGIVGPDQGGGAMGGFSTSTQQSNKLENSFKMIDDKAKGTAMLYANMAQESFQGRMPQSIHMQRVMGMSGLTPGNAERLGDDKTRAALLGLKTPKAEGGSNATGDLMTRLEGQGYDANAYTGAFQSLRGQAGSNFASKNAYMSMAASAQGYGDFGSVMAASARMGQRNTLALGAIGGGIDKAAGIQLGQGILGSGYDPRGTTGGYGTLAAVQAGMGFTGAASDFNKAQAAIGGLNYGSSITMGGIDGYQQGRNLVSAIGTNSGGSTYSQDYLANGMSMKQMLDMANGGKMTESAKALGLTPGMIKSQLGDSMGSVFDRFVDEGKDNPMSNAIRGFQKSGMGMNEYLQKLRKEGDVDSIKTLGASSAMLTGGSEEEGVAAFRTLSGQGAELKSGKIGGKIGGIEKDALESKQKLQEQVDTTLKIIGESLQAVYKAQPKAAKMLTDIGENMGAEAGETIKALGELTASFQAAAAVMNSISGRKPGPGATSSKASAKRK